MTTKPHITLFTRTPVLVNGYFVCPSCSPIQRLRLQLTRKRTPITKRNVSTSGSSIVNATKNIPERFQEVYEALNGVREAAKCHVDLSRLQLAQRGFETENPVVRVAVFGLGGTRAATRLIRLLLADPLSPTEDWETHFESSSTHESRAFFIKYGENYEVESINNLLPTVFIPSNILRKGNLEILVSSLASNIFAANNSITEALQVPTITIPPITAGPDTHIQYPVHRTIVCGDGVDGLLAYSRLATEVKESDSNSTRAIFQLRSDNIPGSHGGDISFVDMDGAEAALDLFRKSARNATAYQMGWDRSRVQPTIDWLSATTINQAVSPDLRNLLDSVLNKADAEIEHAKIARKALIEASSVPQEVRGSLDDAISTWAERAHGELQSSLDEAFDCKTWQSLVWWKLFWRVDDVAMICSSLLQKQWLVRAEKEALWIGGRFQQARLLEQNSTAEVYENAVPTGLKSPDQHSDSHVFSPLQTQITENRSTLLSTSIMPLQALAQRLVMFSLSVTGLTSALSVLTYVSTPTASLSEAGVFAAVGLIYSLGRQQRKWNTARKQWETEIREEGRKVLKLTEDSMRTVVRDYYRPAIPTIETAAKESIRRAKQALSNVR